MNGFKTSLCKVIRHSVFITRPTGRPLLLPLVGKLKTMTKKKPYLFTSCFHSGQDQEIVWVYYLASCECKDVRPCYIFVCSGGSLVTQNDFPLAVLGPGSEAVPHTAVSIFSAARKCCWALVTDQPSSGKPAWDRT